MTRSVVDDTERGELRVSMDQATARLVYELDGDRLLLLHTEVPEVFRGQGVGGRLVDAAVTRARANNLTLVPWCPYARRWLAEHRDDVGDVAVDFETPPRAG